jgi:hypothetical protein
MAARVADGTEAEEAAERQVSRCVLMSRLEVLGGKANWGKEIGEVEEGRGRMKQSEWKVGEQDGERDAKYTLAFTKHREREGFVVLTSQAGQTTASFSFSTPFSLSSLSPDPLSPLTDDLTGDALFFLLVGLALTISRCFPLPFAFPSFAVAGNSQSTPADFPAATRPISTSSNSSRNCFIPSSSSEDPSTTIAASADPARAALEEKEDRFVGDFWKYWKPMKDGKTESAGWKEEKKKG